MNKKITLFLICVLASGGVAMGSIVGDFLLSNKGYQKNIKVEAYLVSEEEIPHLFSARNKGPVIQRSFKDLYQKKVYYFIKVKNLGRRSAWGTLKCRVGDIYLKVKVYIEARAYEDPEHDPRAWEMHLIPMIVQTWDKSDDIPKVHTEWEELYAK